MFRLSIPVALINFIFSKIKDSEHIGLNPYIVQYDKVKYDANKLGKEHSRVKRSLGDRHLFLSFRSHERFLETFLQILKDR